MCTYRMVRYRLPETLQVAVGSVELSSPHGQMPWLPASAGPLTTCQPVWTRVSWGFACAICPMAHRRRAARALSVLLQVCLFVGNAGVRVSWRHSNVKRQRG